MAADRATDGAECNKGWLMSSDTLESCREFSLEKVVLDCERVQTMKKDRPAASGRILRDDLVGSKAVDGRSSYVAQGKLSEKGIVVSFAWGEFWCNNFSLLAFNCP